MKINNTFLSFQFITNFEQNLFQDFNNRTNVFNSIELTHAMFTKKIEESKDDLARKRQKRIKI